MNKFDRDVIKKTSELISKNLIGQEVDEKEYKKYQLIARAMLREEARNPKPSDKPNSLYRKTWKAAGKYDNFIR